MKTIQLLIIKYTIKIFYKIFTIFPIKNRIVFASYRSHKLTDNNLFMYNYLKENYNTIDRLLLLKKFKNNLMGKAIYFFHMLKATYYMATSQYFIVDDYYFPVYVINKRSGTNIVMIWHACGAYKKFGLSIMDKNYGMNRKYHEFVDIHTNYDAVFISSSKLIKYYHEAFNVPEENFYGTGIPRVDFFFKQSVKEKTKLKFYNQYPNFKDKKLILFAPTFRGEGQTSASYDYMFDYEQIYQSTKYIDDYVILIKHHPYVKRKLEFPEKYRNLFYYVNDYHINELMIVCDKMVTDYSSSIFEYSLLNKPLYLFTHDLEEYISQRDFYVDFYKLLPKYTFKDIKDLITVLLENDYDYTEIEKIKISNFDFFDANNTKRVINEILKLN